MNLTETQIDTELVYEGNFIQVYKDHATLPDGKICTTLTLAPIRAQSATRSLSRVAACM